MTSTVSSTSASSQPIVSIAGSNSAAAAGGSVINVGELVSELVSAAQAPQETLITNQTESVTTEISAIGTLQSALSTFQSALSSLDTPSAFNSLTASTSDSSTLTATADSDATAGSYTVTVGTLASAQQLLSNEFSQGASAAIGTGTLSLSLGGTSFNVSVNSSNDTLDGVAAAINSADGNPGITATVIQGGDGGAYLLLSSSLTGAANTIQISETDGGDGLAALTYSAASPGNYNYSRRPGAGCQLRRGRRRAARAPATPGEPTPSAASRSTCSATTDRPRRRTLTVSNNAAAIQTNVASFVSAYNTLVGTFQSLGGYDASTQTAGTTDGQWAADGYPEPDQ